MSLLSQYSWSARNNLISHYIIYTVLLINISKSFWVSIIAPYQSIKKKKKLLFIGWANLSLNWKENAKLLTLDTDDANKCSSGAMYMSWGMLLQKIICLIVIETTLYFAILLYIVKYTLRFVKYLIKFDSIYVRIYLF